MKRSLLIITCLLGLYSCTKDNKIPTKEESIIWPLKQGNYWHYRGTANYANGGSRDTADLILCADTSRLVEGNEYLGVDSFCTEWFRSAKAELWQADAAGTNAGVFAKNVNEGESVIYNSTGNYHYFVDGTTFNGSLTRTAYPGVTVINGYNCSQRTEEVYKNVAGEVVQRRMVYFAANKGPVSFKYYTNPVAGSTDVYLTLQYTLDSLSLQ